jgi:hypothetical protein
MKKSLRRIFTGIELFLFKLRVLTDTSLGRRYDFESEKVLQRFNKLMNSGIIDRKFQKTFAEINHTRDAFAHSFLDVEDLNYRGHPLSACFGASYLSSRLDRRIFKSSNMDGVFMFDVGEFTDALIAKFCEVQFGQLDVEKLFMLCDRLLRERKMLP